MAVSKILKRVIDHLYPTAAAGTRLAFGYCAKLAWAKVCRQRQWYLGVALHPQPRLGRIDRPPTRTRENSSPHSDTFLKQRKSCADLYRL